MDKLLNNNEYREWLRNLKVRIRQTQIKAAVQLNTAMLELYWSIGEDIVSRQAESVWGSGIIKQLSNDLRAEFPKMQGFSTTNIYYIKQFYLFYSQSNTNFPQLGRKTENTIFPQLARKLQISTSKRRRNRKRTKK
jgi:predicted nuclease of restriction endonuclease-like (RecB) superfamily